MPTAHTEITEITTGLGMLGFADLASALAARPRIVRNVGLQHWQRLEDSYASGLYASQFHQAWENGRAFFFASEGLRERAPILVEWKGAHQSPGFDFLPADLRVDHVFLISCKYLSKILANSSPANLFDRCLADRSGGLSGLGWYETVAPEPYADFYSCLRSHLAGQVALPADLGTLSPSDVEAIRRVACGAWPPALMSSWRELSLAVASASARRWRTRLASVARREEMLWRLLRLNPAPYFVLGTSPAGPLRLRIGTPWDWRQLYRLRSFDVWAVKAGQPKVRWHAEVLNRASGAGEVVEGHVEIRWSHGRFSAVEAKVYLDTPQDRVPGYFALA
jgi:hypothetical protein